MDEWTEWCTVTPTQRKEFSDSPGLFEGDPFVVYAGVSCDLQQLDVSKARAERRLAYIESRAVDFKVAEILDAHPDTEDLGGPLNIDAAIGYAEAWAATVYGGRPTLLVPRGMIACTSEGRLQRNLDGTLTTLNGSLVAPYTTHVDLPIPADPVLTMFIVGSTTLFRGPVHSFSVPQQVFVDGTFAPMRALAERIFVPVFDCLMGKLEVTC